MLYLGIYKPTKGGFGVYIRGVDNLSLEFFIEQGKLPQSLSQAPKVTTKSERLVWKKTALAAKNWITRFKLLSEIDQLSRVGNKSLWQHTDKYVSIRVQYYRLIVNGKTQATSPRIAQLEKLGAIFKDFKVTPSITRTHTISEQEYDSIKHEIVVLPSIPKSKRENQFENRINSFKLPLNSNLK